MPYLKGSGISCTLITLCTLVPSNLLVLCQAIVYSEVHACILSLDCHYVLGHCISMIKAGVYTSWGQSKRSLLGPSYAA